MFSPRVLAVLFVGLAACAAAPRQDILEQAELPRPVSGITEDGQDESWFSFPFFGNPLAYFLNLFPTFEDIGPRIISTDDKYQVVINVKDYEKGELKVKVKHGKMFIEGSHEGKDPDRAVFASQFFHTYSLPSNCSASDVTADLTSDGYLVMIALVKGPVDRTKETEVEVPINETGAVYVPPKIEDNDKAEEPVEPTKFAESDQSAESVAPVAPSAAPAPVSDTDDDRKEPTTSPTERKEITEKDNSIPYGNEIVL